MIVIVGGAGIGLLAMVGILIATHSSDTDNTAGTETITSGGSNPFESNPGAAASVSASSGPSTARVIIDGQDQKASGPVRCEIYQAGTISIRIGDIPTAEISDADSPVVHSVNLSSFNNEWWDVSPENAPVLGSAEATKHGNSYKITGTATQGHDTITLGVKKPFEIDVTCP